jgi:multicomponent Na+:H+ antiporter subunit E
MELRQSMRRTALISAILLATWYVLSGKFDVLHFGTGVITAVVIALLYRGVRDVCRFRPVQFLLFLPWLFVQVVISNLRVARLVFSRRMAIRPVFLSQPPGVVGDRALTVLGSSVSLTPGTLTVDVGQDEIFVHALDQKSADDLRDELMSRRVRRIFKALAR